VLETWDCESLAARVLGVRWHQYSPPHVPCYYSRPALRRLFHPARWRLRHYRKWAKWITLERGFAILAQNASSRPLAALFERLGRSRLGAAAVPYALGDLVLAVLERH
jgi:hypothetical protein